MCLILSGNIGFKLWFSPFSSLSSWKRGGLLICDCIIVFLSFIGFFYGFCWKQQIVLNWVYLRVFQLNFVGLWGVGKGSLYWFKVICLGVSQFNLKSNDVDCYDCVLICIIRLL